MPAVKDLPLIGRDGELAVIRESLERAAAGARESILIEGEPGIGKTRLISECIEHATGAGFTVVHGAADEIEQGRSSGVLLRAFERCAPELSRHLDSLPPEPADRRVAIVDALVSICDDASRSAPVALILDDLHWADDETLRALRALTRRTASIPFVLIASCRPASNDPELEALVETIAYDGWHIELPPLDDDAVRSLLDAAANDPSAELRARAASAQGNPFFVLEIAAASAEDFQGAELPKNLRRTVLRRVVQLSEDTNSLLRLAALLGSAIEPEELGVVTGRTVLELLNLLDEAVKARVLEEREGTLVFRHDLVREAIYADMPVSVRKKLHREAARALASSGAPARRVAAHLGAVAEPGDGEAISWLRRSAAEEMQRSPTLAADMLGQVIDLVAADELVVDEIQAERVQALVLAGRVAEASMVASGVLSTLRDATLAADVRVSLGQALFFQGRIQDAGQHFQAAIADAPASERGLVLAEAALNMLLSGQLGQAASFASSALRDADETKDPRALSLATAVDGACRLAHGDAGALDIVRTGVQIADEDFLSEAHRYGALAILGFVLTETDAFDEAVVALRRGMDLDQARGITWALPIQYGLLGLQHFHRGTWDDAVAELETLKGVHDDMDSSLFGPLAHGLLANIAVHRGDLERAKGEIEWGEEQLAERGPQEGVEYLMNARILLAEAMDDLVGALMVAKTACQLAQGMGLELAFRYFAPLLARLARANGTPEEARFAVEAAEVYAERSEIRTASGSALLARGVLEADTDVLLQAVTVLSDGPRPLDLAMAHECAGVALTATGEASQADDQLSQAIAIYERLGARTDVRRVTAALGTTGGKRKRVRPPRPVSGWASLSPTERRVAALVAEGLSNGAVAERLIVSRRTVETHVYHVFQKLGVSSRAELAARATREAAEVQ